MPIHSEYIERLALSLQNSSRAQSQCSPSSASACCVELYDSAADTAEKRKATAIAGLYQRLLNESNELRKRRRRKQQSQHSSSSRLHRSDIVRLLASAAKRMHYHVETSIIEDAVDALLQEVQESSTCRASVLQKARSNHNNGGNTSSNSVKLGREQFHALLNDHPDLLKCLESAHDSGNEDDDDVSPLSFYSKDGAASGSAGGGSGMLTEDTLASSGHDSEETRGEEYAFESQQPGGVWCCRSGSTSSTSCTSSISSCCVKKTRTTQTHWRNQRTALLWNFLYFGANLAAFTYKAYLYVNRPEATDVFGNCIVVARGAAQCLNLNCALILLPVCRHLLTRLRVSHKYMRYIFPFDSVIHYHMFIGLAILFFTVLHVGAHVCDIHRFSLAPEQDLVELFGDKLGDTIPQGQWERWVLLINTPVGITGIIMVVCMLIAYPLTRVRRSNFNTFWWSHQLLLVMLIALCCHGIQSLVEPFQSVYWIMVPLALYLIPRFLRETPRTRCSVLSVAVQKGNVVRLRLTKPPSWNKNLRAGMYAFLNIPQVSRLEWHPFTMTSCPSDDYLEFHCRRAGDWTAKVQDLLQDYVDAAMRYEKPTAGRDIESGGGGGAADTPQPPSLSYSDLVVKVEGPIGASSQGFSHYPIVVLVGAGIGVAPMISVLKELLANPGKMKRVFLYWTVRDRQSFEWFSTLMQDIYHQHQRELVYQSAVETDSKKNNEPPQQVMHIRHFLTSARPAQDRDIGAVLLHYAKRAKHNRTNFDLLLGQYSHHQADIGRPDWEKELLSVKEQAKELGHGKCGVFLCGPEKMAKSVSKQCFRLSNKDPDFHFYFSKETF